MDQQTKVEKRKARISWNRKLGLSLTLLFVGLLISLLIVEIFIRYIQDRRHPPSAVRQQDTRVHHSLTPGSYATTSDYDWKTTYRINSLGMRDKEYAKEKPENTFRILVLGDSFTEGQGVNQDIVFAKILEKYLQIKIKEKKIEVLNGGTFSYSPLLEYLYLKDRGLDLKPDLVIINFDESDISDDLNYESQSLKDENGIPNGFPKIEFKDEGEPKNKLLPFLPKDFKKFLRNNLKLYQVIGDSIRSKSLRIYPEIGNVTITVGDPISDRLLLTRDDVSKFDTLWTLTERNFSLIKKLMIENKIPLIVTTYPYGNQVSGEEWLVGRQVWSLEKGKVYGDRAMKRVEEIGKRNNFPVYNVLEDFRNASREGKFPLYFKGDGHFTPLGHEVMAQALEKRLLDSGLMPR